MRTLIILATLIATFVIGTVAAEAKTYSRTVDYYVGDVSHTGYLAWGDAAAEADVPGILVIHEWWGLNDYARMRCDQLAEMGYVAFAADMYGEGKSTSDPAVAAEWAGAFYADPSLFTTNAQAALDMLKASSGVDPDRLAAIGYCFGGSAVMEMAYDHLPVLGVVSFHGSQPVPTLDQIAKGDITIPVLVCQGADDPYAGPDVVTAFKAGLAKLHTDLTYIEFSHTVHSYTNPAAGNDPSKGVAYNEKAAKRSWMAMREMFQALFAETPATPAPTA
ncbi:MAG: dienelactone hydrolase family protein [bacterium]